MDGGGGDSVTEDTHTLGINWYSIFNPFPSSPLLFLMQVWYLVDIFKHPSASSITAYGGCQCDAHLEHLYGAQSGEPPQLIRIH